MLRTINLDIGNGDPIKTIRLTEEPTIDPIGQKVLTLFLFSVEDYTKTSEGLSPIDTLLLANNGDVQGLASILSPIMLNIKDAINEEELLIDQVSVELTAVDGGIKAFIQVDRADNDTITIPLV